MPRASGSGTPIDPSPVYLRRGTIERCYGPQNDAYSASPGSRSTDRQMVPLAGTKQREAARTSSKKQLQQTADAGTRRDSPFVTDVSFEWAGCSRLSRAEQSVSGRQFRDWPACRMPCCPCGVRTPPRRMDVVSSGATASPRRPNAYPRAPTTNSPCCSWCRQSSVCRSCAVAWPGTVACSWDGRASAASNASDHLTKC